MASKAKTAKATKKAAAPAKTVAKKAPAKKAAASNGAATSHSRASLVKAIATEHGMTQVDVEKVVLSLLTRTTKALKKGEEVKIQPFGAFKVRKRAARSGRNPKTGEKIRIKASKNVSFKAYAGLKDGIR